MDKKEIGLRIKTIRKEKGLSQKELASLMGYKDVSTITKIETGVNDVTTETLYKLCGNLSVSIFDVLRDDSILEDNDNNYIRRIRKYIGHQKIILNAAGGIIVKDNKILLQKRSDNNKWGLPGGMLEVNETYLEAALREIKEETGLNVKPINYLGIYHNHNMIYPNKDESHVICAIYVFEIVGGDLRLDEESLDLKYFSKNELPEIFAQDHRLAINDFFDGVKHQIINENRKYNFINNDISIDFDLSNTMKDLVDKAEQADLLDDYGLYMNLADAIDTRAKNEVSRHLLTEREWKKLVMRYQM